MQFFLFFFLNTRKEDGLREEIPFRGITIQRNRHLLSRFKCRESSRKRQWTAIRSKEYFSRYIVALTRKEEKQGGGEARCQSSRRIVDRSTDPFYLEACSRRWNVEIGKRFLHFLSARRRDATWARAETNLFRRQRKTTRRKKARTILLNESTLTRCYLFIYLLFLIFIYRK